MSTDTQALANADLDPSDQSTSTEYDLPAHIALNDLSNKQVQTLDSTDLPSATPLLHIATLPLQKATLCYTPATPNTDLQPLLNPDQSTTCLFSPSAACYTPAIFSLLSSPASPVSCDPVSTCDTPAAQRTSATCSTAHQSLFQLTPVQRQALDLLQTGQSVTAVARALNIHRVTVQRWKTSHPRFIAELAHRAGLSQTETTLKAQRALDVAISLLLKRLATSPKDAQAIAMRLIASPRLARLAASSSSSISLRQTLSQFQQLRAIDAPADAPADPQLMDNLLAELDAPIPADPPEVPKTPKPKPEPASAKRPPWAPPPKPPLSQVLANHPIRPDLLAVFQQYGCTPEQVDTAARRPDLDPFDIHYFALSVNNSPLTAKLLGECYGDNEPPSGVQVPLGPPPAR